MLLLLRGHTQNLFADNVNELVEILKTKGFGALVGASDKFLDFALMLLEEWVDIFLKEDAGALGLGENKIREEAETDPAIEGEPNNFCQESMLKQRTSDIPSNDKYRP